MIREAIGVGETEEEALQNACNQLGVETHEADFQIIERPVKKKFGRFGKETLAKVRAFVKVSPAETAVNYVKSILAAMGFDSITVTVRDIENGAEINLEGEEVGAVIGRRGETLDAIQQLTGEMPLVLHGGTGIPADMIKKAISLGVSKINVNTECQLAFAAATREYIEAGKDLQGKGFDPRKLLAPGAEAIKATVKEKMELFGSVGKA